MKKIIAMFAVLFATTLVAEGQFKTTLAVKDLDKPIEKYIKNHYENHQTVEAYKYTTTYMMGIQKGDSIRMLVFDSEGKYEYDKPENFEKLMVLQPRTTMSLKDVDNSMTKYIKKHCEGFTLHQAFRYEVVFTVKVAKGEEVITLLFNKEGKFMEIVAPAKEPAGS